jgi:glucose/arabinose dehydrogenase
MLVALLAGLALFTRAEPSSGAGTLHLKTLGGTFSEPVDTAQVPGHPGLIAVVQKDGRILMMRHGKTRDKPFLDIASRVQDNGEQGMLSMAFGPGYAKNRRFYVYYVNHHCASGGACNIEIDGFRASKGSAARAKASTRHKVIEVTHNQAGNHNGGTVAFGPDGDMYFGVGDGGTQPDPENDAQSTDNLLGKISRIKPKANGGYTIPKSNPYVGKPGMDEIYSIGLRNPFRFSFDPKTGNLWVADVGWNTWEEIDRATAAQANGGNFGWHIFEGPKVCTACGFAPGTDPPPRYIAPVHSYPHSAPNGREQGVVIVGGVVVRSPKLPSLDGRYIYSDNYGGDLRAYNPATNKESELGLHVLTPSSFMQAANGAIYITKVGGTHVDKLVDSSAAHPASRPDASHPGDGRGGVRLAHVGNFNSPDYVASAPGVHKTLYVVQRGGKVIAYRHGHRHTFLNISRRTTTEGERGLLSIAFDPRFKHNHLVYTYSTNRQGNIEVDEFHASAQKARKKSRRKVIEIPHPGESNHNGGTIQFGPGGLLYFGTGDGGAGGDPPENAQNKHVLLGKLVRINPHKHGHKPYSIPRTNPFVGHKGRNEIYALGLRNPFRFSFDPKTKHILIGDVGQDSWEEVDYESRKRLRGANFGWDHFEGRHRLHYPGDNEAPRPKHKYRPPIHEYSHANGRCAIVGGYQIREPKLRSLNGRYVYTDLCSNQIRSLVPHRKHASGDRSTGLSVPFPSGFGQAHGRYYVTSLDGPVYRLAPSH